MYNYSGIWYYIVTISVPIFILGFVLLLIGIKHEAAEKKRKTNMILGIIIIAIALGYSIFYGVKLIDPQVECIEGCLVREYHDTSVMQAPFVTAYVFEGDGYELKKTYIMDPFSAKEIYPGGLTIENSYRIFYVKGTNIIVKIEDLK